MELVMRSIHFRGIRQFDVHRKAEQFRVRAVRIALLLRLDPGSFGRLRLQISILKKVGGREEYRAGKATRRVDRDLIRSAPAAKRNALSLRMARPALFVNGIANIWVTREWAKTRLCTHFWEYGLRRAVEPSEFAWQDCEEC
jgi:hypothetical protein